MKRILFTLLLAISAATARADDAARARWEAMTPAERERVVENYRRWKAMPEERRAEIKERHKRFSALPPEEKRALRAVGSTWLEPAT